jgi:hypothetical protein
MPLPEMEYSAAIEGETRFNSVRLKSARLVFGVLLVSDI